MAIWLLKTRSLDSRDFIDELDEETKRRIEKIGYDVTVEPVYGAPRRPGASHISCLDRRQTRDALLGEIQELPKKFRT